MRDSGIQSENKLWTPANIVTVTRILFVPVFVVAILSPWPDYFPNWPAAELWKPWLAALLFAILACTDALDGYLARSRGEVTTFGKFIDPLADKILVTAALLALIELQILPSWVALIIIVREFIVSGLRMVAAAQGVVIAASWYGKAKTVFQIIAVLLFIVKGSDVLLALHIHMEAMLYVVSWGVMIIALVLTIVSMFDYFVKSKEVLGFKAASKNKEVSFISAPDAACETTSCDVYAPSAEEIGRLAVSVVEAAGSKGLQLSTAESCTGGLICGALTEVPGSSVCILGGIVSYSNSVKQHVLEVSSSNLERYGAVSSQVAQEMACGSCKTLRSDIAVSVTGIAGPDGGSEEKPVGTVWFGVASSTSLKSEVQHFNGSRQEVRAQTVLHALELLKTEIDNYS